MLRQGHREKELISSFDHFGSRATFKLRPLFVCSTLTLLTDSLHRRELAVCAMCGRLRVGKDFLLVAGPVGAAMCSAFVCGSHDRWP
jgi:hypothetical protein